MIFYPNIKMQKTGLSVKLLLRDLGPLLILALDGYFSIPSSRRHPGGFYDLPQIECLPLQRGQYQAENYHYA
jgi:hypothetical protein